jgi:hypothetical protein
MGAFWHGLQIGDPNWHPVPVLLALERLPYWCEAQIPPCTAERNPYFGGNAVVIGRIAPHNKTKRP